MLVAIKLNQENLHDYLSNQFELMLSKAMELPPRYALPDKTPVWPSNDQVFLHCGLESLK
ncbi:hypothetical protein BKA69DRAFT_411454 [Paraphysoderma sedebokerense]|nr:hypothetical protein BKA69DRAFT_411454 [Paraphysoderma sedebokerense]